MEHHLSFKEIEKILPLKEVWRILIKQIEINQRDTKDAIIKSFFIDKIEYIIHDHTCEWGDHLSEKTKKTIYAFSMKCLKTFEEYNMITPQKKERFWLYAPTARNQVRPYDYVCQRLTAKGIRHKNCGSN